MFKNATVGAGRFTLTTPRGVVVALLVAFGKAWRGTANLLGCELPEILRLMIGRLFSPARRLPSAWPWCLATLAAATVTFGSFVEARAGTPNVRVWGGNGAQGFPGITNVPAWWTNIVQVDITKGVQSIDDEVVYGLDSQGRLVNYNGIVAPGPFVALACGANTVVALRPDGTLVGGPAEVHDAISIAASETGGLALKSDGTVVVWNTTLPPELTNVVAISATTLGNPRWGPFHSFALRLDGVLVQWHPFSVGEWSSGWTNYHCCIHGVAAMSGDMFLMTNGTVVGKSVSNIVAVAKGLSHGLMLQSNGRVLAEGDNSYGQCNIPLDLDFAVGVAAGQTVSAAIVSPRVPGSPPTITFQPRPQTVRIGGSAYLSTRAVGSVPLRYQWYFNGTNVLQGRTQSALAISDIQQSQAGLYSVVVSNAAGATESQRVLVSVLPVLEIDMVPAIRIYGETGGTYRLEYISTLETTNDWHLLSNVLLTNNPQYYFDLTALGNSHRLYRSVQLP